MASLLAAVWLVLPPAMGGTLEGQVFNREGIPLPGVTVRAVMETGGSVFRPAREEKGVRRATADPQGFFRLDLGAGSLPGRLVLHCGETGTWDSVRYALPAAKDVTARLRGRARAIANFLVEDAPGWRAVLAEINRAGGEQTDQGQVLRRRGLPPEKVATAGGLTEWRYPETIYVFQGEKLTETRPLGRPVPAAGRGAK